MSYDLLRLSLLFRRFVHENTAIAAFECISPPPPNTNTQRALRYSQTCVRTAKYYTSPSMGVELSATNPYVRVDIHLFALFAYLYGVFAHVQKHPSLLGFFLPIQKHSSFITALGVFAYTKALKCFNCLCSLRLYKSTQAF